MNDRNSVPSPARRTWWRLLLLVLCTSGMFGYTASAQISYSTSFNGCLASPCAGWSMTGGFSPSITSAAGTGYTPCNTASAKSNTYSGSPTATLSATTSLGTSSGLFATLNYSYKCIDYSTGAATPAGSVTFTAQSATAAGGPWTTIGTPFTNANSATCVASGAITFTPTTGQPVFVRIIASIVGTLPDCWSVIDDISLSQAAPPPCTPPPSPGATQSSANPACSAVNFTLSMSTPPVGTGLTYQWQSANDNLFSSGLANLGTAVTQVTSQTVAKWYRCNVTCSGNTVSTTPLQVTLGGPAYCATYCLPTGTFGCTDGDVIARVILNTLDNNSGTGCPGGTSGYSNYTTNPGLTTTLQAGGSYGCTVYAGQYGEDYAAWIDYNDNGVFDHPSERIGYTLATVPGSGAVGVLGGSATFPINLACNPPLGIHRMRVRCMYATAGSAITPCGNNAYFEVEDYIVTISAAVPCPAPFNLMATNATTNSVDLSWTLGCAETVWDVDISAVGGGAPVGSGSNPGVTGGITAGGLVQGNVYEYYVRAVCGGPAGVSTWSGPKVFSPLPPNDLCVDAPNASLGAGGTVTRSGATYGATDSEGLGFPSVWESFTITECVSSVVVSMCGTNPPHTAYWGPVYTDCTFATQIDALGSETTSCGDGNISFNYGTLVPGIYYFPIVVAPGFGLNEGPYTVTITAGAACPPPPANTECVNAVALTCGAVVHGTTVNATIVDAPGDCNFYTFTNAGGVWYKASNLCGSVTVDLCATTSGFDTKLGVFSGSCGAWTCVSGNDDFCGLSSSITFAADASLDYYFYVNGFSGYGEFDITLSCTTTPIVASGSVVDNCIGGTFDVLVQIDDNGGLPATINWVATPGGPGSVAGSVGSNNIGTFPLGTSVAVTVSNGGSGCGVDLGTLYSNCPINLVCGNTITVTHCYTNNDGRSFSYHAEPGQTVTISFISGDIAPGDVINTYSGTDNNGTPIPALTLSGPLTGASGTSTGQDIFMQIIADGSGSCQDGDPQASSWMFEVECTPSCSDASAIVDENSDCGTYSFTLSVDVTDYGTGAGAVPETSADLEYIVNAGTPVIIDDVPIGVTNIGPFSINDNVQVLLIHGSDAACNHNFGFYNGDQGCPLLGETCASSILIPSVPTTINGNTSPFVSNYDAVCPYTNPGGKDVVYRYTPPVDQILSMVMCTGTTNYDTKLYVYANTCTGTPVGCNDDACTAPLYGSAFVSTIGGLAVTGGTTYYIVVDAYSPFDEGDFTLEINVLVPPDNNDCADAELITVNADGDCPANAIPGDNSAATDDGGAFSCFAGGPYADVWYTFNSGTATVINYSFPTFAFTSLLVEVHQGSCGGTSVFCDIGVAAVANSIPVTPNTNYWMRVASEGGAGGAFTLCLAAAPPPPVNDLCANAIAVSCNSITTGTTYGSTTTGNPGTCVTALNTAGGVWYTVVGWGGSMTANTCGSTYDTKLGVFDGVCGALNCLGGNDDALCNNTFTLQSSVTWTAALGVTYYLYVTGFSTNTGDFTLEVVCGDNNPTCADNGLTLEFKTDQFSTETTWEIIPIGNSIPACTGGGTYPPNATAVLDHCCLPDGCYRLRVLDAFGDGMYDGATTGGYILRTQGTNKRIIDNRNNYGDFNAGNSYESAMSGQQGFCLPIGLDALIYTSCDKLDWVTGDYIVATPNAAVSAQFGGVNAATSGYEFWLFDPNGTYSFRKFRSHTVSDGFAPNNSTRACHMKINNWAAANQAPTNLLLNVRVRGRVAGVNDEWGPACRFKIDPVRAACPLTKLMDIPGNAQFSCNVTRHYGTGNYVYARPVTGATAYQFRFRIDAENFVTVRNSNNYICQLNWNVLPLQNGKTYQVEVRAFKGGAWCVDTSTPAPGPNFTPWGDVCDLTICNACPVNGGNENMLEEAGTAAGLRMFPNPNRGDQLYVQLDAVEEGVLTVSVDIYDLYGKRVSTRTIAAQDGFVNTVLDLSGDLADGMYLVNITAGEQRYTERLVIQR